MVDRMLRADSRGCWQQGPIYTILQCTIQSFHKSSMTLCLSFTSLHKSSQDHYLLPQWSHKSSQDHDLLPLWSYNPYLCLSAYRDACIALYRRYAIVLYCSTPLHLCPRRNAGPVWVVEYDTFFAGFRFSRGAGSGHVDFSHKGHSWIFSIES